MTQERRINASAPTSSAEKLTTNEARLIQVIKSIVTVLEYSADTGAAVVIAKEVLEYVGEE